MGYYIVVHTPTMGEIQKSQLTIPRNVPLREQNRRMNGVQTNSAQKRIRKGYHLQSRGIQLGYLYVMIKPNYNSS